MTLGIRGHSPNAKTTYTLEKKLVIVEQFTGDVEIRELRLFTRHSEGMAQEAGRRLRLALCTGTRIREGGFLAPQNRRHCANLLSAFIPLR